MAICVESARLTACKCEEIVRCSPMSWWIFRFDPKCCRIRNPHHLTIYILLTICHCFTLSYVFFSVGFVFALDIELHVVLP